VNPSTDDVVEAAELFVRIADLKRRGAHGHGARMLCDYVGTDPVDAGKRYYWLARCGAIVIADLLRIHGQGDRTDGFWGLVPLTENAIDNAPAGDLAAMRAVTAFLNHDEPAAADVLLTHIEATGLVGIAATFGAVLEMYVATVDGLCV
jgi:hypothetical protein